MRGHIAGNTPKTASTRAVPKGGKVDLNQDTFGSQKMYARKIAHMAPALLDRKEMTMASSIPSVLVIDDEDQVLEMMGELFAALGISRVRRASSAEEALKILKNERFSVIVSDYRLEGMDGVAFVEQLRAGGNATPVLMLSGAPDKMAVIRAARQTRVDFFPKPFEVDKLLGAMERLAEAA
jgi:CheY-like chemotaxis protein